MKTSKNTLLVAGISLLTACAGFTAAADEAMPATGADKTYTGTVTALDTNDGVLSVKGWWFYNKKFNLGKDCTYKLLDKNSAAVTDLRAGQKVSVSYRDAHGVLIADRVEQEAMRFEGMVKSIDPMTHTLTLHRNGGDYHMQLAGDCKVVLRNGKAGIYTDIEPGNHVTVTYETPGGPKVVHQIAQTSEKFGGTLAAIDLDARTVKVKSMFAAKKFILADNCTIVINGDLDGKLSGLKPKDQLEVSYDEINGVNVANRIATGTGPVPAAAPSETTSL